MATISKYDKEIEDDMWDDVFNSLANHKLQHKANGDLVGAKMAEIALETAKALKELTDARVTVEAE